MNTKHRVLLVEDDLAMADEFAHIFRAAGFEITAVDNVNDALKALGGAKYCAVVSDLDIKEEQSAIKGHTAHGFALVEAIRRLFPGKGRASPWLPIVMVSGRAPEAEPAVELMKAGADDLVQKPASRKALVKALSEAMSASGLRTHEDCGRLHPITGDHRSQTIEISIPGDRSARRTRVRLAAHEADLSESALKVLLQLMVGRLEGRRLHKTELGAKPKEASFKKVSRLKSEIGHVVIRALKPILNDQRGNYWLADTVIVGPCDTAKIDGLGNATLTDLARRLEVLRASDGKAG